MKFGFIAHPTSVELKRHVKMVDLLTRTQADAENGYKQANWQRKNLVPFVDFGQIRSLTGATCEGVLHYMPATAEEMIRTPRAIAERVILATRQLADAGALLVGLGGFTGIVGDRGQRTLEASGIPVTTGNSLTAYATWQNVLTIFSHLKLAPETQEVVVVGYPGSIALVVAKLLLRAGCRVILVHRGESHDRELHLRYLAPEFHSQVSLTNDIREAYGKPHIYVAATSTGHVIDPAMLAPGSVVVDAALPRDVMPEVARRSDILIVDGGLVSADEGFSLGSSTMGLSPTKMMNGCLAETVVLALAGRAEAFSIGRELTEAKVIEIGQLAATHGVTPQRMASYGEKLEDSAIGALRRFHAPTTSTLDRAEILRLFGEHINPVMREFFEAHHIERVFVRGSGCTLTDADGKEYLDFVAGYGCLNMGHNHPRTVRALQSFLSCGAPTFVQYVSAPAETSLLAQRLCALAPGKLERVFFSNSGTEAVEAALKLALAASDRVRILYCDNGYHGKTLGALSVTGRAKHRAAFEPLLQRCDSLPFGDIEAFQSELEKGDVAAFILEPIQGEGGVVLPPDGYLAAVRALCDQHDCILILDEIQTGLGRTGKRFACDWENVGPDILVLAKSLSGGLVPIGATLARRDLWDKAYGSRDRFVLHSSTFGGGNLAAAVALESLSLMEDENLAANAMIIGASLKEGLESVASEYPFIKAVRGRGLMIAVEFDNSFDGAMSSFAREFAGRFAGNALQMFRFLSDKSKAHVELAVKEIEAGLQEMFVMRFMTKLSQDHGILTFVTANNSKVMRIQPPLVLSTDQATRFVGAFRQVCEDMSTVIE